MCWFHLHTKKKWNKTPQEIWLFLSIDSWYNLIVESLVKKNLKQSILLFFVFLVFILFIYFLFTLDNEGAAFAKVNWSIPIVSQTESAADPPFFWGWHSSLLTSYIFLIVCVLPTSSYRNPVIMSLPYINYLCIDKISTVIFICAHTHTHTHTNKFYIYIYINPWIYIYLDFFGFFHKVDGNRNLDLKIVMHT